MVAENEGHHLALRETKKNRVFVEGLTQKKSNDFLEVIADLQKALGKRHTNETQMNERSSRSHFIINFDI